MERVRIEIVTDPASGMILVQALSEPGDTLIVRSDPIYHSHQEAEAEVTKIIRAAWPDTAPVHGDPSIGV